MKTLAPTLITTALVLGPLGCGAGALTMDSGDDDDTSDGADADDGDTGDGGPGDGDGDALAGCIDDGQLARAIAVVDSEAQLVHVLEPGGDELTLPAPLPDGVEAPASINASNSEAFIAVVTGYSIYAPPNIDEGAALRLYDRNTGALSWELEFDEYRLGSTYVDDQARVVAAVGWSSNPNPAGIMVVDGQLSELQNFAPAGALGASGFMPGWIINDAHETTGSGLYNPFTDQLVTVTTGNTPPGWRAMGETIEYIDNLSPVPRLVTAGPQGGSAIELGPFAGVEALVYSEGMAGDYRLLATQSGDPEDPPQLLRVHVPSGELLEIELDPPAGLEPFDCYFSVTRIDADGRVLVELRDPGAAQIHAWDPDTEVWTALGLPMTNVDDISVGRSWGHVLELRAAGFNETYCVQTEWSEPPASALDGTSIQLARIDPALSVVVNIEGFGYGAVTVDEQEQCASWPGEDGRRIYDLDDDDELELAIDGGQLLWLD